MVYRGDDGHRPAAARHRLGCPATQGETLGEFPCGGKTAADDWRLLAPALGPEQTPLHQREAPAGGPAHAEEEPHGGLSAQQLRSSEETLFLLIIHEQCVFF